jgi:protein SCO1
VHARTVGVELTPALRAPAASHAGGRFVGALVSLAALAAAALLFAIVRPVQVLPLLQPAPPLVVRDADGGVIALANSPGAILVLQLSALRCAAPCADGLAAIQALQRRFETVPPRLPVRLVTVLLDGNVPPAAMRAQEAALGAHPRWWRVAGADPAALKDGVGAGLGIYYTVADGRRVTFDPATVIVDGRGIVRAEYRTAAPDPRRILSDLDLVVREASSRGAARAAYAAAHLFLCYPRYPR